jgi:hypothetical protein
MKTRRTLLLFSLITPFALAQAETMTVSMESFLEPTGFSITEGDDLQLRVSELAGPQTNNASHILLESLSPLSEGSLVYASPYYGLEVSSGEVQDEGVVYLEMPADVQVPEGSVSSPIVGIVERSGSWEDYNTNPPTSSVGGASGDGDYDGGSIVLSLVRDSETFSGAANYTVIDENTIELDPFSLTKDGTDTIELSGATLIRDGSTFNGAVTNLGEDALYDSLLFTVRLADIPDVDADGVPDISDSDIGPSGLAVGEWNTTNLGFLWGLTPDWGWSYVFGYIYVPLDPYVYHPHFGWMVEVASFPIGDGNGQNRWFVSLEGYGWMFVQDNEGGHFRRNYINAEDFTWDNFREPKG